MNLAIRKRMVFWMVCLFCVMLCAQSALYAAEKKIVLKKYPGFKIGFLTANFAKVYPSTPANLKKLIDFAGEHGFAFIEIRDSNATLTLDECKDLSAYAKQKGVEVIYAMNVGLLDPNYFEVFTRGVANASVFHGPKVVRTGANGLEMVNDEKKTYWTAAEFAKLVQNANKAAAIAKTYKLRLVVENAREGLHGDGVSTFGTTEFFGPNGVSQDVGLQMDVANFFCTSRVPSAPDAVAAFVETHAGRVAYIHLKTSKDHKQQPVLNGNELPFENYFNPLQANGKKYIGIELDPVGTVDEAFANLTQSVEYLKKNY